MELRFSSISKIDDPKLLLSLLELFAFSRGEALFTDLDIDLDTVLEDAIADPAKFNLEQESELLQNEPVAARKLIEEFASDSVFRLVEEREEKYGRNYAFKRDAGKSGTLLLKSPDKLNPAAFATAWLSFFYALNTDGLLNMDPKEKRAIRMLYAKVFELVALMAATHIGPSVGWWTGRGWKEEDKIQNFQRVCELVGYGSVKSADQWEETERQANDAGADGFLITTVGGKISSASVCIALGATVQKTQRRKKKIGKDERDRLLAFFLHRPTVALIGAAADPYSEEPALAQDYAKANCLYLHGEVLWNLLSLYGQQTWDEPLVKLQNEIESSLKSEIRKALDGAKIVISGAQVNPLETFQNYEVAA